MISKDDKPIYSSKPTIWYYLLVIFFPVMFFLADDSNEIFKDWDAHNLNWLWKLFAIFVFFGVPILLILLRREIKLFENRIEINQPAIKRTKVYNMHDLMYWQIVEFYAYKAGSHTNLTLKFKYKKLDFNKIELKSFKRLQAVLESNYSDKKR